MKLDFTNNVSPLLCGLSFLNGSCLLRIPRVDTSDCLLFGHRFPYC